MVKNMDSKPTSSFSGTSPLDLVVRQVQRLTPEISLFRLASACSQPLPAWRAGAHIAVRLGNGLTRAYSLCSDPAETGHYDIAVKRESQGRGGSIALHREAVPGARLSATAPRNLFDLHEGAPYHLLLGGGIGITPLIAMASELARRGERFHLAVFCREEQHLPLPGDWRDRNWAEAVSVHCCPEPESASAVLAQLLATLPEGGHVYHCGPSGFMTAVTAHCAHLPDSRVHSEHFGAAAPAMAAKTSTPQTPTHMGGAAAETEANADATGATTHPAAAPATSTVELFLARQQRSVMLASGENMADALRHAGIELDTVCEQGICGSCVTRYLEGEPLHNDTCLSADEQREYLAPCCAGSRSSRLVLDL